MSRTDILITPAGGTGTMLIFLPSGATAVVMNYWDNVAEKSVQMDAINFWNMEYLDIQYFPVLLEDYEHTTDRPECQKPVDDPYYESQVIIVRTSGMLATHACARLNNSQSSCMHAIISQIA